MMRIRKLIFSMFMKVVKFLWQRNPWKLSLIHKVYIFLYERFRPRDVFYEIEGNKMYLDGSAIGVPSIPLATDLLFGPSEKLVGQVLKKEVKPGMIALDLGAHFGYYTLLMAKLVGDEGRVFAFEPDPDNYALLAKNIAINDYKNIVPIQKAVSNRTAQVKLFLTDTSFGHHLCASPNEGEKFVLVDTITLDEFFEDKDLPIDFIKMNIEGAELVALEGMSNLIKRNNKLKIVTEFGPSFLRRIGSSPEEFLNRLIGYGFRLYHMSEERKSVEPCDTSSLLEAYTGDTWTKLLCLRE